MSPSRHQFIMIQYLPFALLFTANNSILKFKDGDSSSIGVFKTQLYLILDWFYRWRGPMSLCLNHKIL